MPRERQKRVVRAPMREPVDMLDELGQVGENPGWLDQAEMVCNLARHDGMPILILGPTGAGKEGFARLAHKASGRAGPFIAVNSNTLDSAMAQDALFGHEKGAFTGAAAMKKGAFEDADGGTLFLDEIGDLSPDVQGLTLRAIQEGEIARIGSTKTIPVDVQIVCATWRDLGQLVAEGRFREDLLFRLGPVPIVMPSLAERAGDIPLLVDHFLKTERTLSRAQLRVTPEGIAALQAYHWPGNVRELRSVLHSLVVYSAYGDSREAGAEEVGRALGRQRAFLRGMGKGSTDAQSDPPPQAEAPPPEISEDDFPDLSRREVECLRLLVSHYAEAEDASALEWLERVEAVGMGKLFNGGTIRSKTTRLGRFLRRASGRLIQVTGRAYTVVLWQRQSESKRPFYRVERVYSV